MEESWLSLTADYFETVCRKVYDNYLKGQGFTAGQADEAGSLTYTRERVYLRVHYYVEDSPNYSPMVSIGLVGEGILYPNFDRIGLWYAIPPSVEVREYGLWRFSNAEELEEVLTRIRNEVVDVYARPLWEAPGYLAELIEKRFEEVKSERKGDMSKAKRLEAEVAFRSRKYHKAAMLYSQIDESELSSVDRKRYELSKRYGA